MSKRYAIWDKKSQIITPSGAVFTAEQWKEKHPVALIDGIKIVCAKGEINGAFFGTLGQMMQMCEDKVDFSSCTTDDEILCAIEAYEDSLNEVSASPTAEERIAAALEYQVMASLPDEV